MFSGFFIFIAPYITPVIIIGGVINLVVFFVSKSKIEKLSDSVHSWAYYGIRGEGSTDVKGLIKSSDSAARWYTFYANITAFFPLMGILGTVCALLNSSPGGDVSNDFFVALDTTAGGLFFAIIFKLADAFISSKLDRALDEADYQIHKLTQEVGMHYAQTETGHRN